MVSLPNLLMQQAPTAKDHAPIKAAVSAHLAVAIAILTFAPIRLRNLVSIELGRHLIKPGGLNTPYWLVFPGYDVKNRVDLNFQFDQTLTDLIDEYIREFRHPLLRGANAYWLFPGEAGQPKQKLFFSNQITERIQKMTGLRITVHHIEFELPPQLVRIFDITQGARRCGSAVLAVAMLGLALSVSQLLRPAQARPAPPTIEEIDLARRIAAKQSRPDAILALMGDKSLLFWSQAFAS